MKKILITGGSGYIGKAFKEYVKSYQAREEEPAWQIDSISLRDDAWQQASFSGYDAVFHTAGIAHADVGRASEETKAMYYRVNCDLAVKAAEKARREGVKQFIYMSSVIVYGDSAPAGKRKNITADTEPAPANFYGDSKYRAELKLQKLQTEDFRIALIRAPMVYGKDSKGNFPMLEKIADRLPVFPRLENQRSMIYVENLAQFVRQLVERGEGGLFFPQNSEYASTAELVRLIAAAKGGKVRFWRALNPLVQLVSRLPGPAGRLCGKAFGSLTIDQGLSCPEGYSRPEYSLEESIRKIYEDQCNHGGV